MTKTVESALSQEDEQAVEKVYAALGENLEAREAFWRIEQGLRGVTLANEDVHAEWVKAQEEAARWRLATLYLADVTAATAEYDGTLKSTSRARSKRHVDICEMTDRLIRGKETPSRVASESAVLQRLANAIKALVEREIAK